MEHEWNMEQSTENALPAMGTTTTMYIYICMCIREEWGALKNSYSVEFTKLYWWIIYQIEYE